jgi:hypothetical protein
MVAPHPTLLVLPLLFLSLPPLRILHLLLHAIKLQQRINHRFHLTTLFRSQSIELPEFHLERARSSRRSRRLSGQAHSRLPIEHTRSLTPHEARELRNAVPMMAQEGGTQIQITTEPSQLARQS